MRLMKKTFKVLIILMSIIVIIVLAFVGYRRYTLYPTGWGKVLRAAQKENPLIQNITCQADRGNTCRVEVFMKKETTPEDVDAVFSWLKEKIYTKETWNIIDKHYYKIQGGSALRIYIDFSFGGEYMYAFEAPVRDGTPWTVQFFGETDVYGYGSYTYNGSLAEILPDGR